MALTSDIPHLAVDPYSDDVLRDPQDYYRQLRKAGPVVRVDQSEGFDLVAVGRDSVARAIYTNPRDFLSGRGGGILDIQSTENFRPPAQMQEVDEPVHIQTRGAMNEVISPRNVRTLRGQFQAVADQLVDKLLEQRTFDAQTEFAEAFPLRVIPDMVMGARPEGRENLLRYSTWAFENMGPLTPRVRRVLDELGDVSAIIAWITEGCAKENVSPDSLGAKVWQAAADGKITDAQAANMIRSLLGAGMDTTIHSLANVTYRLATNPREWARLADEPSKAKFAYDEGLRYDSVVRQVFRTPARDVEVEGIPIHEGQKIMLVGGAVNRDPERWGPDADVFDIDRDASGHLSMGVGIHQCVGQPIARLEADVLLGTLARRVATIELAGTPERLLNNSLFGFESLPVTVTPK